MRYLKTFESVDLENDLSDFCETYLAYLIDEGFYIDINWIILTEKEDKV